MSEAQPFLIPRQLDFDLLRKRIEELFALEETGEEPVGALYYDTFDWRLFRAGLVLSRQGGQFTLAESSGAILCSGGGSRRKKQFWWDFEEGELQDRLRPVVEPRALVPKFGLSGGMRNFSLLNSDQKTVLRLTLVKRSGQCGGQQFELAPVLLVESLRGYPGPFSRLSELFADAGLTVCEGGYDLVAQVLTELSIDPAETDSKFAVTLGRKETVGQAVRDICLHLRSTILRNVPGALEDIDTEFLHDLRVSVRRTRSLLSLMKKQLPATDHAHFRQEFKWLGGITGPVRDLDVYLLKSAEFRAMLPEELQPGLTWFFEELARQRKREMRLLRMRLRSPRVSRLFADWERFLLELPSRQDFPRDKRRCWKVVRKIIWKRFARVLKGGAAITPQTEGGKLHELRIECKKFRYLLEFFRSLFSEEMIDEFLKHMKKLQTNLGDFNDTVVQKRMLGQLLESLGPGEAHGVEAAAAIGGLIVHLNDLQGEFRGTFEQTFAGFATPENEELLERIVSAEESGPPGET